MKYIFFRSIVISLMCSLSLSAQTIDPVIQRFVSSQGLEHALVGLCVKDMDGKTVYAFNQDKLLTPASILKVLTTATAMELLGENYRYTTKLSYLEGNPSRLVVTGSGDPTLGSEYSEEKCRDFLGKWVSEIKDQKFAEQPFRLLVDDSLFGYEGVSPQWTWEDLGNYYAAGAYGVSVFDNTYQILFNTMNVDSAPLILGIEPSIPNLAIQNNLQLNTTGKDNGYIYGIPFSNDRRIYGDIPSGRTSFSIKGDIPDPGLFLANTLRDTLVSVGLMVIDCQTVRESPLQGEKLKTFYEHISPELKDIVRQINWRSNNHYAEHLIRTIGIEGQIVDRTNALKKGISRIGSFWKSKQMDTTSLVMYDGCGLSPLNAVTPEFMTDVLVEIQRGKNGKSFRESLPKAGEEGTVRNFLKGNGLEGKVWVKSGSISGVQCYAGYYMDGERKYAFTLMVNKFSGPRGVVVKNIEQLLLSLF